MTPQLHAHISTKIEAHYSIVTLLQVTAMTAQ